MVDFSPKKRILLVEDHATMRRVIRTLIERHPAYEVCAEAGDAERAEVSAAADQPDLAIVDISLPGVDGLELTKTLRKLNPNMPILILSMHNEDIYVDAAFRAGASGYLMKHDAAQNIAEALDCICQGQIYSRRAKSAKN